MAHALSAGKSSATLSLYHWTSCLSYMVYEVSQLMVGKCLLSLSLVSSAQKTRTIRRVFCVTGSDRSPPGGETAPMTEMDPSSPHRVLARHARS